jgi:hypothetical protein
MVGLSSETQESRSALESRTLQRTEHEHTKTQKKNMSILRNLAQNSACRKKKGCFLQNPGALLAFLSYGKLSENLFHGPDKNQILEDVIGDSPKSGCFSETSLQSPRHDLFPPVRLLQHANRQVSQMGVGKSPSLGHAIFHTVSHEQHSAGLENSTGTQIVCQLSSSHFACRSRSSCWRRLTSVGPGKHDNLCCLAGSTSLQILHSF